MSRGLLWENPTKDTSSCPLVAKSCLTFATPWTVAFQAPLPMGFSRQECWSGLPFPSPEQKTLFALKSSFQRFSQETQWGVGKGARDGKNANKSVVKSITTAGNQSLIPPAERGRQRGHSLCLSPQTAKEVNIISCRSLAEDFWGGNDSVSPPPPEKVLSGWKSGLCTGMDGPRRY